jgi:hypothetical protein
MCQKYNTTGIIGSYEVALAFTFLWQRMKLGYEKFKLLYRFDDVDLTLPKPSDKPASSRLPINREDKHIFP